MYERIYKSFLRWFAHIKRMDTKITKRVNGEECVGSRLVCRPQKRWIDSVNDGLKKRGLNVRQTRYELSGE